MRVLAAAMLVGCLLLAAAEAKDMEAQCGGELCTIVLGNKIADHV